MDFNNLELYDITLKIECILQFITWTQLKVLIKKKKKKSI